MADCSSYPKMRSTVKWSVLIFFLLSFPTFTHELHTDEDGQVTYLGNEAILIDAGGMKLMFDPFFHNDFGIYQWVPREMHNKMLKGEAPFDGIDAVFISHAHEDHFSARDLQTFLTNNPQSVLVAPEQAISQLRALKGADIEPARLVEVSLDFGQAPMVHSLDAVSFDVVRIPHAGWPGRADVQNMVFRVQLPTGVVVMHMGDADPDVKHYLPFREHWNKMHTDNAFPPYWFFFSLEGRDILQSYLNVKQSTGLHVPVKVPEFLIKEGYPHFSRPGEVQKLGKH